MRPFLLGMILGAMITAPILSSAAPDTPLWFGGKGARHFVVTTTSADAQRWFDQGLTLCYGFNHAEAIRSFEQATRADPDCAMAWWGIAYAWGTHINNPEMDTEANEKAHAALTTAIGKLGRASSRRCPAATRCRRPRTARRWTRPMRRRCARPGGPTRRTLTSAPCSPSR